MRLQVISENKLLIFRKEYGIGNYIMYNYVLQKMWQKIG